MRANVSGVGKTSLIERYISKLHSKEVAPTIGASFFNCKLILDDVKVKMQVRLIRNFFFIFFS